MLMMDERRRQDFFRQLEEFEREGTGNHRRILDEIGDLVQQAGVGMRRPAHASLQTLRFRVELARDLVVPLAALEDDEVFEQPRAILVE